MSVVMPSRMAQVGRARWVVPDGSCQMGRARWVVNDIRGADNGKYQS